MLRYNIANIALVIFLFSIRFSTSAQSFHEDAILGTWLTADKTGEITIFKNSNFFFGKISAGTSEQKYDIHNPDKERRKEPLLGLIILKDLKFDGDKTVWDGGSIYDPKNGKRYSCHVTLVNDKTLRITGYIGFSWIGRSEEWTRID